MTSGRSEARTATQRSFPVLGLVSRRAAAPSGWQSPPGRRRATTKCDLVGAEGLDPAATQAKGTHQALVGWIGTPSRVPHAAHRVGARPVVGVGWDVFNLDRTISQGYPTDDGLTVNGVGVFALVGPVLRAVRPRRPQSGTGRRREGTERPIGGDTGGRPPRRSGRGPAASSNPVPPIPAEDPAYRRKGERSTAAAPPSAIRVIRRLLVVLGHLEAGVHGQAPRCRRAHG